LIKLIKEQIDLWKIVVCCQVLFISNNVIHTELWLIDGRMSNSSIYDFFDYVILVYIK
jgi:hypothetical protein